MATSQMIESQPPESREVLKTEWELYNRSVKNAFFGFLESASIGAIVGFVIGAGLALGAAAGIFPALPLLSSSVLGAAVQVAVAFGGFAGSFGATAAIQATRDASQLFLAHEQGTPLPGQPGIAYTMPRPDKIGCFCDRVSGSRGKQEGVVYL